MTAKIIRGERVGKLGKLAVGCSAAIFDSGKEKVLLVHRTDNGHWSVPGGFMEAGESVAEACAREVLEETGLRVCVSQLIGVYSSPDMLLEYADGNRYQLVVLHFATESLGGDLCLSDETTDIKYFSGAEIEEMHFIELDRQRIDDAFAA